MKDNSRFYSSLGLLVLLNAIIKPVWIFAIDRQVQNAVGIEIYGTYFSIFNLCLVFSFILDLGLSSYYNRQLAANDQSVLSMAGSFIFIKILLTALYIAIILLICYITGIERWDIVLYVILIMALTSFFIFFRAIITSQQWFSTDAWLSVLDKLLMIVFCGMFLYLPWVLGGISIVRFLQLQIGCTAFAILVSLITILSRKFHFSFKKLIPSSSVFKAALPYTIIILLMAFHSRVDGFLLDRVSGPVEAGKYAAAYRLLDASNMVGVLLGSFLLPYISRHWHDRKNIETVILNVRHLLVVFSISIASVTVFLAPWVQDLMYHHVDPASVQILQLCLPSVIGYSLVYIYGTVMTATGHIRAFSYITAASVIINMGLNIILIPGQGAKGSCIAAIVSQTFSGLATLLYARQKLKIDIGVQSLLMYIFIGIFVSVVLYFGRELPVNKWWLISSIALIVLFLLRAGRLIDIKNWRKTVSQ
jgi:O-antigen/teichoic acid export membrane protein